MKTAEKERKSISCNFYISLIFVCIHLNIVDKSCKFCEINYHLSHSPFSPQSIKLLLKKNKHAMWIYSTNNVSYTSHHAS